MMVHCHGSVEDNKDFPPPFSLEGGLLSTLRGSDDKSRESTMEDPQRINNDPMKEAQSSEQVGGQDGSPNATHTQEGSEAETTRDVALLLTEMADIASKEVPLPTTTSQSPVTAAADPTPMTVEPTDPPSPRSPRFATLCSLTESNYRREIEQSDGGGRIRTVSISSPDISPRQSPAYVRFEPYSIIGRRSGSDSLSPPSSPNFTAAMAARPRCYSTGDADDLLYLPSAPNLISLRRPLQPQVGRKTRPIKTTILRKKFSWKNYPELEAFLIANREEYLRHSTLNYTVQQKQYNNLLTERMLALAAEHGYVFDESDFSFVTVRDRIRCYYKSYVQSLKKRGIIIGYAARKAGLVSESDLETSAATAGKIYLPSTSA